MQHLPASALPRPHQTAYQAPVDRRPANRPPPCTSTDVIEHYGYDSVRESDPAVDLDSSTGRTGGDNIGDLVHTDLALTTGGRSLIALLDQAQIPTLDVCRAVLDERGVDMNVYKFGDPQRIGFFRFSCTIWNTAPE